MAIQPHENPFIERKVWSEQPELPTHISEYQIIEVDRVSLKDPEVTSSGAHIYQELCTFHDTHGHRVVREATVAVPNSNLVEAIPHAVVDSDAWTTGKRGLNRIQIKELANMGYHVVWLHHADERSPLQRNKSITRSARQAHALLDNMGTSADFSVSEVLVDGYSRSGMIGEKFIALALSHGREVLFSNLTAPCYATDMSRKEKLETLVEQLPKEIRGIGSVVLRHFKRAVAQRDFEDLIEFAQTFNFHPKNIVHETMWIPALLNANVGPIIDHQPRDTAGIRNFFGADTMSQQAVYVDLYAPLRNVVVVRHDGPHVEGAGPDYIYEVRKAQFAQLGRAILNGEQLDAARIAQKAELDLRDLSIVR